MAKQRRSPEERKKIQAIIEEFKNLRIRNTVRSSLKIITSKYGIKSNTFKDWLEDYDTLSYVTINALDRRALRLKISLPVILIPLFASIISIANPSLFYNLLHENQIKESESAIVLGLDFKGGTRIIYEATDVKWKDEEKVNEQLEKSKDILTERLSEYGDYEPSIKVAKGKKQIIVELPEGYDFNRISEIIGQTGSLEIIALKEYVKPEEVFFSQVPDSLFDEVIATKEDIADAVIVEEQGRYVRLDFYNEELIHEKLAKYAGRSVSINLSEISVGLLKISESFADGGPIGNVIIGDASSQNPMEKEIAEYYLLLLKWETLPITLRKVETLKIGSLLSEQQFFIGISAFIFGLIIIFISLLILYGTYMGTVGCIALGYCVILVLGVFNATGIVLNLPGLGGIILTIGISVDAFILIFENIKEVIREKHNKGAKILYDPDTIWDTIKKIEGQLLILRLTTLVGAIVLFFFPGPIKGFAVTMMVGLVVSFLASSRIVIGGLLILTEGTGEKISRVTYGIPFFENEYVEKVMRSLLKLKYRFGLISGLAALMAVAVIYFNGFKLTNDFQSGSELRINISNIDNPHGAQNLLERFSKENGFEIYSIQESESENEGLDLILKSSALEEAQIQQLLVYLNENRFDSNLLAEWTTNPGVSQTTLIRWIFAVSMSILAILIFCLLPFSKVRIQHHRILPSFITIGTVIHDVLIILLMISILKIELSIPVFVAILVLIGYSINDSLILIYRIDNTINGLKKRKFKINSYANIIDNSVVSIRSRTLNTSLTTIACLLPILLVNISFINPFIITIILGLLIGTYSSIFLVNPLIERILNPKFRTDNTDTASLNI